MAAKNTLKYKRNRLPPLLKIVNEAIDTCLRTLESPSFKGTIGDLIKLIRLRLTFEPLQPPTTTVRWLDTLLQPPETQTVV